MACASLSSARRVNLAFEVSLVGVYRNAQGTVKFQAAAKSECGFVAEPRISDHLVSLVKCFLLRFSWKSRRFWRTTANRTIVQAEGTWES